MTAVPFSWMYGDPQNIIDDLRSLRQRLDEGERRLREQERRRKARRIRKLTKLALAGKLKGNGNAR